MAKVRPGGMGLFLADLSSAFSHRPEPDDLMNVPLVFLGVYSPNTLFNVGKRGNFRIFLEDVPGWQ